MEGEEIVIDGYSSMSCFVIVISTNWKHIHLLNMLFDFHFVCIWTVITSIVVVGDVPFEPLPVIPWICLLTWKFKSVECFVELWSWGKALRNSNSLNRNRICFVLGFLVFEGKLESQVVDGVVDGQTWAFKDSVQLEIVTCHNIQEIHLKTTDLNLENWFTSWQFYNVEKSIGSWHLGSVNKDNRNVLNIIHCIDVHCILYTGKVHICIRSQGIPVHW